MPSQREEKKLSVVTRTKKTASTEYRTLLHPGAFESTRVYYRQTV